MNELMVRGINGRIKEWFNGKGNQWESKVMVKW